MPRICPNCSTRLGRPAARGVTSKRSLRDEFKSVVVRCPNCGVNLRTVTTPVGRVSTAVAAVLAMLLFYWGIRHIADPDWDRINTDLVIGILIIFIPFVLIIAKWGYRYIVADGSGDAANLS